MFYKGWRGSRLAWDQLWELGRNAAGLKSPTYFIPTFKYTNNVGLHGFVWEHRDYSKERARLLGLSQRALNEGNTNAVVFVTGDQVFAFEFLYFHPGWPCTKYFKKSKCLWSKKEHISTHLSAFDSIGLSWWQSKCLNPRRTGQARWKYEIYGYFKTQILISVV